MCFRWSRKLVSSLVYAGFPKFACCRCEFPRWSCPSVIGPQLLLPIELFEAAEKLTAQSSLLAHELAHILTRPEGYLVRLLELLVTVHALLVASRGLVGVLGITETRRPVL